MTVTGEDGPTITARNVMGGDVYFCSGQSNMVFPLKLAYSPAAEMATAFQYKDFRFFTTARDFSPTPLWDLRASPADCNNKTEQCAMACDSEPCNRWLTVENATANNNSFLENFSAVCFLTIRDIARMHTSTKPVALIQSAWGGTRVEAWMSAKAIAAAAPLAQGFRPPPRTAQNNVSVLWNAMVAPWSKFAVRTALWYQVMSCHL